MEPNTATYPTDVSEVIKRGLSNNKPTNGQSQPLFSSQGAIMHGHGFGAGQNEIIREFSNDIGAGIVMGGDQSTSYIGTELIEFLRPKNQGRP